MTFGTLGTPTHLHSHFSLVVWVDSHFTSTEFISKEKLVPKSYGANSQKNTIFSIINNKTEINIIFRENWIDTSNLNYFVENYYFRSDFYFAEKVLTIYKN